MHVRPLHRLATLTTLVAASALVLGCGSESSAYGASEGGAAGSAAASQPARSSVTSTSEQVSAPAETPPSLDPQELPAVTVYKSPTCGCCEAWVQHLRDSGFEVEVKNQQDVESVKNMLGVPPQLRSCHTAVVGKYLVEGHVPASDIKRLLADKPQVAGLAVPGMPVGSPGMEMPGQPAQHYDVVAFDAHGKATVFQSH